MAEAPKKENPSTFTRVPIYVPILVGVAMFVASVWGGGEMARGEIAQQSLDLSTAQGQLVKAATSVPPGTVLSADMLEVVDTYANRVEPYCLTRGTAAVGRKTRFGLEKGQVLIVRDLE